MEEVKIGGIYKHYKGGVYRVLGIGNNTDTLRPSVYYYSMTYDSYWVRDYEEFVGLNEFGEKRFVLDPYCAV